MRSIYSQPVLSERYLNRSFHWDVSHQPKKSKGESRQEDRRSALHRHPVILSFVIIIKQMTAGYAFGDPGLGPENGASVSSANGRRGGPAGFERGKP